MVCVVVFVQLLRNAWWVVVAFVVVRAAVMFRLALELPNNASRVVVHVRVAPAEVAPTVEMLDNLRAVGLERAAVLVTLTRPRPLVLFIIAVVVVVFDLLTMVCQETLNLVLVVHILVVVFVCVVVLTGASQMHSSNAVATRVVVV